MYDGHPTKIIPRIVEIQRVVARNNAITVEAIKNDSRRRDYAWPRQLAAYLCREMTRCSYPEIGRMFGDRDHTTIIFAYRKVAAMLPEREDISETLQRYRDEIIQMASERIEAEGVSRLRPAPPPTAQQPKNNLDSPAWTADELILLFALTRRKLPMKEIARDFPTRSALAVRDKARRLGFMGAQPLHADAPEAFDEVFQ
jgi:hypothetical protein